MVNSFVVNSTLTVDVYVIPELHHCSLLRAKKQLIITNEQTIINVGSHALELGYTLETSALELWLWLLWFLALTQSD